MKLSAPTQVIFIISLILAIIGILPMLGIALTPVLGWALPVGYILLALGVTMKGL